MGLLLALRLVLSPLLKFFLDLCGERSLGEELGGAVT